jgi:hypothetical protein
MIKKDGACSTLLLFPTNGKQGPVALTNNKQENVDQIQADNVIKCSGVRINHKKYINIFFKRSEKFKNLH